MLLVVTGKKNLEFSLYIRFWEIHFRKRCSQWRLTYLRKQKLNSSEFSEIYTSRYDESSGKLSNCTSNTAPNDLSTSAVTTTITPSLPPSQHHHYYIHLHTITTALTTSISTNLQTLPSPPSPPWSSLTTQLLPTHIPVFPKGWPITTWSEILWGSY